MFHNYNDLSCLIHYQSFYNNYSRHSKISVSTKKRCVLSFFSHSDSLQPMDCSPPDSSVRGILQARILERVAIPFPRVSSWSRDRTHVSPVLADGLFTSSTAWEALIKNRGRVFKKRWGRILGNISSKLKKPDKWEELII